MEEEEEEEEEEREERGEEVEREEGEEEEEEGETGEEEGDAEWESGDGDADGDGDVLTWMPSMLTLRLGEEEVWERTGGRREGEGKDCRQSEGEVGGAEVPRSDDVSGVSPMPLKDARSRCCGSIAAECANDEKKSKFDWSTPPMGCGEERGRD